MCSAVFVKDHRRHLTRNIGISSKLPESASLDISVNEDNSPIALLRHGKQIPSPIDRELTREPTTTGHLLDLGECARIAVNREIDKGVRDNSGAVFGVKVGDAQGVFVPGGHDEKFGIRLQTKTKWAY